MNDDENTSFLNKPKFSVQVNMVTNKDDPVPSFNCIGTTSSKIGWFWEVFIRLVLTVIFGLSALYIDPFLRYVEIHDWPRYNYPHAEPETIHPAVVFAVIVAVPLVLISIVTIIGTKVWTTKYRRKLVAEKQIKAHVHRRMLTEWLLLILATTMAYLLNGVITDVIKNTYGRPRPDFLSRCFAPEDPIFRTIGDKENLWVTLPSRIFNVSNTVLQMKAVEDFGDAEPISFPYIEDVKALIDYKDCINQDDVFLRRGGRRSFPSGHTSFSFAGATLCALYSFYWLGKYSSDIAMMRHVQVPGLSLRLGTFFIWFLPAIYVGISRTQDYRHHPGDVFAGAFIGIVTTYFSFIQYFNIRLFPLKTIANSKPSDPTPQSEETDFNSSI